MRSAGSRSGPRPSLAARPKPSDTNPARQAGYGAHPGPPGYKVERRARHGPRSRPDQGVGPIGNCELE